MTKQYLTELKKLRQILAVKMLQTIQIANTGHLGACCSSLELMLVLYFGNLLRYDTKNPKHPGRDYVINRGHLGPLKYNIFNMLGWLRDEEMSQYRQFGSRLAGHEDMFLTPGVDISPNGSLGMVLSYAVGARIGLADQNRDNRLFCFLGDGEETEGNVSEAARHAAHLKTKNLICIIDRNKGQLSTRLPKTDGATDLHNLWRAYGWQVIALEDGHDIEAIAQAYQEAISRAEIGPVVIIAETIKGHGIPGAEEDFCGYHVFHGSEVNETVRSIDIEGVINDLMATGLEEYTLPIKELPPVKLEEKIIGDREALHREIFPIEAEEYSYDFEHRILTSLDAILKDRLYVITADYPIRSLTYSPEEFPLKNCHYLNVGIREQHMTAMIHGIMQVRPEAHCVVLCGDAFLYRHMDQINVLAQAKTKVVFLSVQAGLSGARNGSTHQSSGQSGALLLMPGIYVAEPGSLTELFQAIDEGLWDFTGPAYVRIHKEFMPRLFGTESKKAGYSLTDKWHEKPEMTIVTSGLIAAPAYKAKKQLETMGINCNLISVYSLSTCLNQTDSFGQYIPNDTPLLIYYNGNVNTLATVVNQNLVSARINPSTIIKRGFDLGQSGSIPDLLKYFQLDAESITADCLKIRA